MIRKSKIKSIFAREIIDSRGNPTVEVDLKTDLGIFTSSVPSGASTGKNEAKELRDGGKRYNGKGVLKAVKNINEKISPKLKGKNVLDQEAIDKEMIRIDGKKDKSNLGANAILGVSMSVARAASFAINIPLYKYIADISLNVSPLFIPQPSFNILNGGVHADNGLDIQEFMIAPFFKFKERNKQLDKKCFKESLRISSEIYHELKKIINKKYPLGGGVGDEGGFAPPVKNADQALSLILEAIKKIGNQEKVGIALDCAASQFFSNKKYKIDNNLFTKEKLIKYYEGLIKKYPIFALEDPFAEEDWDGFSKINERIGKDIKIIGDDLLSTNPERIAKAHKAKACNGLLLKLNQIGTVTESIEAAHLANSFGWDIMVSHRSGETCDNFISDFAVGIGSNFIKSGAPARGERTSKYNRLLKIEEEIKPS
jgi:enolase